MPQVAEQMGAGKVTFAGVLPSIREGEGPATLGVEMNNWTHSCKILLQRKHIWGVLLSATGVEKGKVNSGSPKKMSIGDIRRPSTVLQYSGETCMVAGATSGGPRRKPVSSEPSNNVLLLAKKSSSLPRSWHLKTMDNSKT